MLRHYIRKPSYDSHLAHQTSGVLWFTNLPVVYYFFYDVEIKSRWIVPDTVLTWELVELDTMLLEQT